MGLLKKIGQAAATRTANKAANKAAKKAASKSNDPLVTATYQGAGEPNLANLGVREVNTSKKGSVVTHEYVDTTNATISKQAATIKKQAAEIKSLGSSNSIAATAKKSSSVSRILGTGAAALGAGGLAFTGISLYNSFKNSSDPETPTQESTGDPDWIIPSYEERNSGEGGTTYYVGSDGYGDEGNTGYTESSSIVDFIGNYGIYIAIGIIILLIIASSKTQKKTKGKKEAKA